MALEVDKINVNGVDIIICDSVARKTISNFSTTYVNATGEYIDYSYCINNNTKFIEFANPIKKDVEIKKWVNVMVLPTNLRPTKLVRRVVFTTNNFMIFQIAINGVCSIYTNELVESGTYISGGFSYL